MKKRKIKQFNLSFDCYYYNYFNSEKNKLKSKKDINQDYFLIKEKENKGLVDKISNIFWKIIKKKIINNLDYIIFVPLKKTTFSLIPSISKKLTNIINQSDQYLKLDKKVILIDNLFRIIDYRKFYKFFFSENERKLEIKDKIFINDNEYKKFNWCKKEVLIIDDIVSTGTTIAKITSLLKEKEETLNFKALCYGSVYQWKKIYK
jgi:predicted amidophosphoribosyltransferase